jgi:hypothetical protein
LLAFPPSVTLVARRKLRSPGCCGLASFQQKVGRIGREDGSDSLVVTFLAQRASDAYFAHHLDRLIDPRHLDPIALKDFNPDALRTHLFTAAVEYLALQGDEVLLIGPQKSSIEDPWDEKVRTARAYLHDNRAVVRDYVLRATAQSGIAGPIADEAIHRLIGLSDLLLTVLRGVYEHGGTPAQLFYENAEPDVTAVFRDVLQQRDTLQPALER